MLIVQEDEQGLIKALAMTVQKLSTYAISKGEVFKIGVSGGSLVKFLSLGLKEVNTDFSNWRIFFCDERVVPTDNADSTFGAYKKELIGVVPLKEDQFVQIKQGVSSKEAADDYIEQMNKYFPPNELPRFNLLLLGIGPDGHTCSLFPGHPLLDETSVWVAPIDDSPKPPPSRITLTFPVINNAKAIVFALAGEAKADMVKRILVDKENLPASKVQPTSGQVYWILDKGAAKHLDPSFHV